jgi:acyl dehydratase
MKRLYLEDFEVGQVFDCGSVRPGREEIVRFAREFDPQPFHLDEEAARATPYGGIIASGWHTCSLWMRMLVDSVLSRSASLGSPGVDELRWLKPVRPGDLLTATMEVLEVRPSRSRPDRGSVRTRSRMVSEDGEPVMEMTSWILVGRRPPADRGASAPRP